MIQSSGGDDRPLLASAVLSAEGFADVRLRIEGHEGEVAVLGAAAESFERLAGPAGERVVARIKGLGFRYVALDLALPTDER